MKQFVLAALLSTTQAAIGDPCTGLTDTCGADAKLCCGVATNGKVSDAEGKATSESVPNMAICNNKPDADGKSLATAAAGKLTGAGADKTEISYLFPAEGFACISTPAPPTPTPAPPLPTSGVGMACTSSKDTCGDDAKLCCGIAMNGSVDASDPKVMMPNVAICNNKPGSDGSVLALNFAGTL